MSSKKTSKMQQIINYRIRVTLKDTRSLVGNMLAYDKHMNLVLGDCDEYRTIKRKAKQPVAEDEEPPLEMKRSLGLVILRGETIVSLSVEGPPPVQDDAAAAKGMGLAAGPGRGAPAGRGMGMGAPGAPPPAMMRGGPMGGMPMPPPGMPGFGMAPPPGMAPPGFRPPG